jgi:uncharacterized protein YbcV (DUF1398 family)
MHMNVHNVIIHCTTDSDHGRISFGEVIGKLMAAGVERYHADLVRSEKTYYLPCGQSEILPSAVGPLTPAMEFSADGVVAAVRAAQAGSIKYQEFCDRVAAAGCVAYVVSITGRRVVYYGRTGDSHVEWFPGAK